MTASAEYAHVDDGDQLHCTGEGIKTLDVICHDLPEGAKIDGLVGMNFLQTFLIR